ncbi:hypothetical protein Ssi03_25640 [Sphaerisporangium siamense]|uniref:HEPN domain-containing protein n=1 Tax=Sphaerisporangium siamense TaxID=795645 RepID=A0A7W7D4D5_9ACTN|nr:hypothetical protein [Sphaerisporangium siamense]MBB4700110.1 hypothetical protein [Sphaerisporangium siamense]GII84574.1 hypothetical protein Ssi03_25640 [Sphaerisporangium siamense]
MTGPEHYREAEKLLAQYGDPEFAAIDLAAAQVHATLALAAATALARVDGDRASVTYNAWHEAAGLPR